MKILLLLVVALSTAILLSLKRNVKRSLPFEKSSEPYEWRWKVLFFEKRSNFRVDSSLKHKFTRYNTRIKNWCITWFSVSCTFCRIFSLKFFFRGGQQHSTHTFWTTSPAPKNQPINSWGFSAISLRQHLKVSFAIIHLADLRTSSTNKLQARDSPFCFVWILFSEKQVATSAKRKSCQQKRNLLRIFSFWFGILYLGVKMVLWTFRAKKLQRWLLGIKLDQELNRRCLLYEM